jgi:hypothetical protein
MAFFFDSQILFAVKYHTLFGAVKFVGIGFYLSLILLWVFVQALVWLAERYSRQISGTQWWRSGILAAIGMIVGIMSWQIPGLFSSEETVDVISAMTSSLMLGFLVAWMLLGRLYFFEFFHRAIVAVGVPILVFCALALGKILEWKMAGVS